MPVSSHHDPSRQSVRVEEARTLDCVDDGAEPGSVVWRVEGVVRVGKNVVIIRFPFTVCRR